MAIFTFTNSTGITINDNTVLSQDLSIYGIVGTIADVSISLDGFIHSFADDLDMLLVGPDGISNLEFLSDAGGSYDFDGDISFADGGTIISDGGNGTNIVTGTYAPSSYATGEDDSYYGTTTGGINSADTAGAATFETSFGGLDANGDWTLVVGDDNSPDSFLGAIDSWSLDITTDNNDAAITGTDRDDTISIDVTDVTGGIGTWDRDGDIVGFSGLTGTVDMIGGVGNDTLTNDPFGVINMFGDLRVYSETTNQILGDDTFFGFSSGNAHGDFQNVNSTALVVGGDDVFNGAFRSAFGDGENISGGARVTGGNDIFVATNADSLSLNLFAGDVANVTDSTLIGGDDRIIAYRPYGNDNFIYGDARDVYNSLVLGGDDYIEATDAQDEIYGDVISINSGSVVIGGDDTVYGFGGDDIIYGDWVNNSATSIGGNDYIDGGDGNDQIYGNGGDDYIIGGLGEDDIDGGDGIDTASYENANARIIADLQNSAINIGEASGDAYTDVENLVGSSFNDQLRGDSNDNTFFGGGFTDKIFGRAGNDTLNGEAGGDAIYGNAGADTMTGGDDTVRDRFIYFNSSESGTGLGNRDIITDFTSGEDRIEISRFDANSIGGGGNDVFVFVDDAGFTAEGQLGYYQDVAGDMTIVQADFDGDGIADFEIELTGLVDLTAADFLL